MTRWVFLSFHFSPPGKIQHWLQVAGRKRWTLHPPNATFYSELHPRRWLGKAARHTDASGGALQCEQRPGDVLFVPKLWGHCTINLGETVGVATPFSLRGGVDYGAL